MFCDMHQYVPAGKIGAAEVIHDTPSDFEVMRASMRGMPTSKKVHTRLLVDGKLWMTDADFERRTNWDVVRQAKGRVLIAGLGIGLILRPILAKSEVTHVTVIERSADVIALIAPNFDSPKLEIINADIYKWKPERGAKWDAIYFDVWADVCTENLDEMATLNRRFARFKAKGAWVGSWCREILLARRRQERRMGW